ncbi:PorT protein [Flavobacterium magnum]|uniref:PorT protein n=1 Tax=Flavobacterium magnum TaxID=2162713 RepID=A0A2S0RDB0_9FLAO|nr:porin family protein [Flavobacterium magnum]AWA29624.1 PorT protein [Flavobacterium magnum]
MKKVFFSIMVFVGTVAQAQFGSLFAKNPIINLENFDKQRVHWGYFLGFNSYDFKFDYKTTPDVDVLVESSIGFNVGLVGNLRFNDYFDLRFEPGLYFNQRNLTFPGFTNTFDGLREVKSTYIHFPLLLKISSVRTGNIKPYVVGGVGSALNLSSNATAKDDNANNRFRMIKWTNFYEVGVGIDIYFEYFKFSPSIRGVFSLNDELVRDNDPNSPWTSNIEKMTTRAVFVNFTFH